MRIYLSLIITAILLSFSTAYFALNLQKEQLATPEDIAEIKDLEREFQKKSTPVMELDLSSMYPTRDYFQLIQPLIQPFSRTSILSPECKKQTDRMNKSPSDKDEIWESYRCRENSLPANFFEFSPFIHESGVSYAYLAFTSGMSFFTDENWIKKHLNFFHISELHLLPPDALDERFKILAGLNHAHFDAIIRGDHSLLTEENYFFKKQQKTGHLYKVYSRLDFDKFLNKKSYYAKSLTVGEKCYFIQGTICWLKDASNLLQRLRPSSIIIFVASILILVLVGVSLYSRISMQNREEERKRHALRVLTHELRTPIANLMLQVERLNKQSDSVSPAVQEELLRMEGEIYRLKRLAEKSSSYLSSNNENGLINFEYKEIPSFNELVQSVVEDYPDHNIGLKLLEKDESANLDVYWFSICFKNIIENAINHGAKPIMVSLHRDGKFLRIDVIDHGKYSRERKDAQTKGLGMGLSIVEKIMTEMNGKMSVAQNPTIFSLSFRQNV